MSAESTLRAYLGAMKDPSNLVDQTRIETLNKQLDEEFDPVNRILIRSDIVRASDTSEVKKELEDRVVEVLPDFVRSYNVSLDILVEEGISKELLQRAGLLKVGKGRRVRRQQSSSPAHPRTTSSEVVEWIRAQGALPFTIQDAIKETGASRITVQKAIQTSGATQVGASSTGKQGRQPALYSIVAPVERMTLPAPPQ